MSRPKPLTTQTTCTIKVPVTLRDQFILACQSADTTASAVLRGAMRDYLLEHPAPAQSLSIAVANEEVL